ncbi:CYFA0S24e00408g1_1 [Cyberlindnera fabianii]|uniref:CYFA0S24e00408g1_1 n=1 Tax=Cyberlindnera fabianii TaxID=36022 RepID=A0A061BB79_CYBFA|nr:CYFA0S24e00408g1_1 [Cyberlindnera fabianii]
MAFIDGYLLPIVELIVSVGLPALLTLKALQLTTKNDIATASPQSNYNHNHTHILSFWLSFWLLSSVGLLAGVNGHVRCAIALIYFSQSSSTTQLLLHIYQQNLLPFTATILYRVANIQASESEIDHWVGELLETICFDIPHFNRGVTTSPTRSPHKTFFSWLTLTRPKSRRSSNPSFNRNTLSPVTSSNSETVTYPETYPDSPPEQNMIPLTMSRVRNTVATRREAEELTNSPNRSHSIHVGTLNKKGSRSNLRSSSWNTPSQQLADPDRILQVPTTMNSSHSSTRLNSSSGNSGLSSRVPSGNLVFEDPPDRRSFKESLKEMFA